MKKLISVMLLLAMVLGLFAGCGKDKGTPEGLLSAAEYLTSMYQTAGKDEAILITTDQDVLKNVVVDGVSYAIEWTVEVTEGDADSVTVSESKKENHVKLDIPLHSGSDILFTATATVSDTEGNTQAVTFNYKVAGVKLAGEGMTMEQLVEAAYALGENEAMEGLAVLTGKITAVNTPYDEGYKNITVTMVVGELTDKPIKCYRLKGDGAETLNVGDTITVSGTLKNYNGTIEFDAGCMLDELEKGTPPDSGSDDAGDHIMAAYALPENNSLTYPSTLTGTITSVDTPYDGAYQNITVTIVVAGFEEYPIKCYRLKGEGADRLAVSDMITVTGTLCNYKGVVEFAQGCTLVEIVNGTPVPPPDDQLKIVDEAYALADNTALEYNATLSGNVTSIDTAYSAEFQNITVSIIVPGREQKPIQCYRLKGNGADTLAVGDTIVVNGTIKKYGNKVQFDEGCALISVTKNGPLFEKPDTEVGIVDQAYQLKRDQALPYLAELTGKVVAVPNLYDATYKNITVVIQIPGRELLPLTCFRLKGTDVDKIAEDDIITVSGTIKNYNGSIQFDAGCTMIARTSGGKEPNKAETDPIKIIDLAYALAENGQMTYDVTLTGKVTEFKDAYTEKYKSITVIFAVPGRESKPIQLFGLKGDDVTNVAVGDTLTVAGRIKNYNGTVELVSGIITSRIPGGGRPPVVETEPNRILAAGSALANDKELPYDVTLSGKVLSIDQVYDSQYENVTVTIAVDGTSQSLKLYRLKGEGVDKVVMSDVITVEGRIKMYSGKLELVSCTMTKRIPGNVDTETDYKKIVDDAYALEQGQQLGYPAVLKGKITALKSPYDSKYKNMTVVITVDGREDKPIECYRMKGDDIGNHLCVGDTITVSGVIKNYNGTVEFDSGCQMTARTPGSVSKPSDPKQIVDAAFALAENAVLPYFATLTGTVKSVDEPYSSQFSNVTVTITVQGTNGPKDIQCYRLKGDGADSVAVGNTITVTGAIKRFVRDKDNVHEDKIEFDSGCVLEGLQKSGSLYVVSDPLVSEVDRNSGAVQPRIAETNAAKILNDAYALEEDQSLAYEATLTGKIISVKTPYDSYWKNISVIIEVPGHADKPILCYRLAGEGAAELLVEDTITVTGTITNYKGTVEFAQGCTLDNVIPGGGTAPVAPEDPKQIVEEAYALSQGASLPYQPTLTGVITELGTYNEEYGDLTLKILVEGKEFECYALKGENLQELAVGDTITVTGTVKNYYGKIEFDKPTLDAVVKGDGPQPAGTVYYLFGFINNADYGVNADSANMGQYKFVDGMVTAQFTADSYVGVKTEDNGIWYMTQGWLGFETQTATLYDSSTISGADKLFVPANKELVFTITENGDGTLTLTYAEPVVDDDDVPTTPEEIVNAAYALQPGESMTGTYTLTGKITSVDYAYSEANQDITVTMEIAGCEGKPIKCYRLKGEGVDVIGVKDRITVTGILKNYNGTIEFDAGCTLDSYELNDDPAPVAPEDPKQIVDEAFALEAGDSLPYTAKLTGVIVSVDQAYSEQYKNITVTIEVEGTNGKKRIECFRLKGSGVEGLCAGDIITVEGTIMRYIKTDAETGEVVTDKVEFSLPTLLSVNKPGTTPDDNDDEKQDQEGEGDKTKTPAQIVAEAFALKNGESLPYEATLTGKITAVGYAYNAANGDITVDITVEGKTLKCYRMTGTGVDKINVGDTITVKGTIKNYNGIVEFDKPVLVSVTAANPGGSTGDKTPDTGDYSLIVPMILMVMASATLVVLSKKKFYN